ncbi:hypothetical protein GHT06_010764 [Daphnia sinensis]|uniref:Uncharacterized protein n=1 Tax=Daphnia sinensis TaxID=1820382 RepID=A0AAD5LIG4_9CRUS|nr:hypothetical protein GHT06_010764 [Daphnia sinensis]
MAINNIGCTNFFQAVATGSVICLRKAFHEEAEFITNVAQSYNDVGETPLLLAIKNRNFKTIKFLINELKVSVIQVVNFLVDNEQYNPPVDLTQHPLLLSSRTTRLQQIRTLELIGAAYIFYGNKASRLHGYSCWRQAFLLRQSSSGTTIPKVPLQLSNRGETALRNKFEVQTLEQLERLKIQRRAHWKVQAFLVSRRISSELGYFPNLFTVVNLFNFSLRKWSERQLGTNRALKVSLFFIELFDNQWWENYIEDDAMIAWEVINNTLHYLCAILELLSKLPNNLSFSDLMFILRFACNHLQKTYINYWPTSILYQTRKNEISNMESLILIVVTLITEKQNIFTLSDIQEFKQCLSHHVFLCGHSNPCLCDQFHHYGPSNPRKSPELVFQLVIF